MNNKDTDRFISFVIVTYNSENYIDACLKSIQKEMSGRRYEVFIVDNASSRSLPDLEAEYSNLTLIRNSVNLGFATANNIGIEMAKGDTIWLLNPDTLLEEGCVEHALSCFKDPGVGIIGNHLLNPDGSLQKSVFVNISVMTETAKALALPGLLKLLMNRMPQFKDRLGMLRKYEASMPDSGDPVAVPMIIGASMIVRRETMDQIGLFDARYFMYLEEADLCFRAHLSGWRVVYCPDSRVIHYGGHATWDVADRIYIEQFRSLLLYFSLYYPIWHVLACRAALILAALIRITLIPTPFYKLDLGMGNYQADNRVIHFSRKDALISYLKLMAQALTPVPRKQGW